MTFRLASFLLAVLSVGLVHCHPDASQHLLNWNALLSEKVSQIYPDFFVTSAQGQDPKVVWIGCSDSRVPESVITGAAPGDIFVERNIANQLRADDPNSMAVLEYSLKHLQVEHVVVVGHTKCGGVTAALAAAQANSNPSLTLNNEPASDPLNLWLAPITKLALELKPQYSSKSEDDALEFLIEQNVKRQVDNIAKTAVMKTIWRNEMKGSGRKVRVHGWVYDLATGLLKDLNVTRGPSGTQETFSI